jgi:hypothetical protein
MKNRNFANILFGIAVSLFLNTACISDRHTEQANGDEAIPRIESEFMVKLPTGMSEARYAKRIIDPDYLPYRAIASVKMTQAEYLTMITSTATQLTTDAGYVAVLNTSGYFHTFDNTDAMFPMIDWWPPSRIDQVKALNIVGPKGQVFIAYGHDKAYFMGQFSNCPAC